MTRILCTKCNRPLKGCICEYICSINNEINVIALQHPSEVQQSKGTVTLLSNSMEHCTVIVGEDFSNNDLLNNLFLEHSNEIALLYPGEHSQELSVSGPYDKNLKYVILLDGTWKKAYKMFMLSKNLQQLPCLSLPASLQGQYAIRKTNKPNALSTLEACCYALGFLEKNPIKYQPLLQSFVEFNKFQLSFRQ